MLLKKNIIHTALHERAIYIALGLLKARWGKVSSDALRFCKAERVPKLSALLIMGILVKELCAKAWWFFGYARKALDYSSGQLVGVFLQKS